MPNPTATPRDLPRQHSTVELFTDKMPITAGNFVKLAKSGFYDGLHFHRVINGFMLQFGCPNSKDPKSTRAGTGDGPDGTIKDEHPPNAKLSNEPGTLSMANTGRPNSGELPVLRQHRPQRVPRLVQPRREKHPVFGKVTAGMDVVHEDREDEDRRRRSPATPVRMNKVTVTGA
jgi:cyclophilin family peptidyl-prolyl cis-trans isomerase